MLQGGEVLAKGGQVGLPGCAAELNLLQCGLQSPALRARSVCLHLQLGMLRLGRMYLLQWTEAGYQREKRGQAGDDASHQPPARRTRRVHLHLQLCMLRLGCIYLLQ